MRRDELPGLLCRPILERRHQRLRVGIGEVDCAGKTCLANELGAALDGQVPVIRASIDGFHNPRDLRYKRGAASPEGYYRGSFDSAKLKAALLEPLSAGGDGRYRALLAAALGFAPGAGLDD